MTSTELKTLFLTNGVPETVATEAMISIVEQLEFMNKNLDRIGDKLVNLTDVAKTMARKS